MRKVFLSICVMLLASLTAFAAENGPNLIDNPGFEGRAQQFADRWQTITLGPPPTIEIDQQEKHSGVRSARISAAETSRAYVASDYIPVAPGESISASAWIKCKDVPEGKGAVIVIGEFANSQAKNPTVVKFGVAKVTDKAWQKVDGVQKVPEGASKMRLRIGFSYASGTIWIDDVAAHAEQPLVATIALDDSQVSPGDGGIPVDVINRAHLRTQQQLRIQMPGAARSEVFSLTGEPVQRVLVPVNLEKRGKQKVKMELTDARGDKTIHSEEREITVPPPIVLMPAVPTHWAVEDGAPQIDGELQLAVAKAQREGATLSVKLISSSKQVIASWTSDKTDELPDGITEYQIKATKLPVGDYTLVSELKPRSGQAVTSEQPWAVIPRAMAKTTLNADGYPVINGKAIFPLGIFNGGKFKEQADAGYTVTHAYNAMRVVPGTHPDDQKAKDFLDQTYANGMHMCCMVPLEFAYSGEWDAFRRRIRMFRNHPGLLCWDEEESLARGTTNMETLAKMRQIVQEEDPNHPFMVGDSRDVIGRVTDRSNFFPLKYMDLGMWWWYPIPLQPRATTNALEGQESAPSDEMAPPSFLAQRNTDKPIWVGVQAYRHTEKERYPNYTEYRAQPYIAMIAGAKGIMWYGGSVTDGVYLHPEEANLKDMERVVHEMGEMSAVMMSPTGDTPKFSPATAPMSVMLKKTKDGPVLMAVNRGAKAIEVTFDVAQSSGSAKVLQENRSVRVSEGKLKDKFEPYEVHVYSLLR